jgi:hypothetical protein
MGRIPAIGNIRGGYFVVLFNRTVFERWGLRCSRQGSLRAVLRAFPQAPGRPGGPMIEVTYLGKTQRKHKVTLVWQIDEDMDDGKPFLVRRRYTCSLHEKACCR